MGKKTGPKPTDPGKVVVKRSLLTDAHGIPQAIVIDDANRHDMKLARPTLEALEVERPSLLTMASSQAPTAVSWPQWHSYALFSSLNASK